MGSVPGAVAVADGQIQALAGQIDPVVVGHDPQIDVRMFTIEGLQSRQQPSACEGADDADGQHLLKPPACIAIQCGADPVEGVRQHGDQRLPLVRQGQTARQATEQGDAQTAFQLRHLMADRALTDAEFDGGAGEVQVPGGGFESAQGVQGQLGAVHDQGMRSVHGFVQI